MNDKNRTYTRFPLARRIEHLVMLLSFTTLGLTGLPQKYPLAGVSVFIVDLLGGIENLRYLHHIAAVVLMFGTAYHIIVAGYKVFVLRTRMNMLPNLQDVKDGWQALMYNIGRAKSFPQMGRYTFEEKMEYWAFVWGTIIMGLTGFLMWNPITSTKFLPGEWIPAARAAHGGEAVLAVLAIILWHMYGVHVKRFNKSMWTGKMSEEEMLHEHPLELADIKAGLAEPVIQPGELRKRQMVYYPIAGILTAAMLAGILGFINTEDTALTTIVPPEVQQQVFVPQTPTPLPTLAPTATPIPSPTPAPATATLEGQPAGTAVAAQGPSWDGEVSPILQTKCGTCHGPTAMGGLNLSTYADMLNGSQSGPVVLPGDSENSLMVTVQEAGGHPGQLAPEELEIIRAWIGAGAVESLAPVPASAPVWEGDIAILFQTKCSTCHGPSAIGGLNLSTYADVLNGGASGPVVVPGDGANSLLVTKQQAGGHPGQLTPDEIAHVQAWIDSGALEK
jgi:cytochrome b subunit of formate dehydrogenase/mono/diheme cytochrome c family protein